MTPPPPPLPAIAVVCPAQLPRRRCATLLTSSKSPRTRGRRSRSTVRDRTLSRFHFPGTRNIITDCHGIETACGFVLRLGFRRLRIIVQAKQSPTILVGSRLLADCFCGWESGEPGISIRTLMEWN